MAEDKEAPIIQVAEQVYRWKETSKLSMRLAYVMTDLLTEVNHFCKERGIEISDGMDSLMEEAQGLFAGIKATQTLPLADLLRKPPTTLRAPPESKQGDDFDRKPREGNSSRERQSYMTAGAETPV